MVHIYNRNASYLKKTRHTVKISTGKHRHIKFAPSVLVLLVTLSAAIFAQIKTLPEMSAEIDNYVTLRSKALAAEGKRIDSGKREELIREKRTLARKYAEEAVGRSDLKGADYYYLGLLYVAAEDNDKALDAMDRYLAQFPAESKGTMIQSARSWQVIFSASQTRLARI